MKKEATCYDKAVDLLSRRAHFRLELEQKLRKRGFPAEEIEAALERLEGFGYLDERSTAEHYVAGRQRRGPYGPRRLAADLRQRGVDADLAREVIDAQIEDEGVLVREVAERWLAVKAHRANAAALARHLERAGFSSGRVLEAVRRFEREQAAED